MADAGCFRAVWLAARCTESRSFAAKESATVENDREKFSFLFCPFVPARSDRSQRQNQKRFHTLAKLVDR